MAKYKPEFRLDVTGTLIGMGLLSAIGNYALYQAANNAPNPGLAVVIVGLQGGVITLLSWSFFKNVLTPLQTVGMVLALAGIFFVSIGSK